MRFVLVFSQGWRKEEGEQVEVLPLMSINCANSEEQVLLIHVNKIATRVEAAWTGILLQSHHLPVMNVSCGTSRDVLFCLSDGGGVGRWGRGGYFCRVGRGGRGWKAVNEG